MRVGAKTEPFESGGFEPSCTCTPEEGARTLLDTTIDPRALDWLSVIAEP